jgi:hypothetical protein
MHSVHQVHASGAERIDYTKAKIIRAQSEQFTIMGFVTQTDYVDEAMRKLEQQCPKGNIVGLTTQLSTSLGFFSWHNKVLIQGFCQKT